LPEETRIGIARRDITPPVGESLSGYIHREPPSTGILDPLSLQAMTVEESGTAAVVIAADLVGSDGPANEALRAAVSEATGVPATHIVWHSVHTHASPSFHKYRGMARASDAYLDQVTAAAVTAAGEAMARAVPMEAHWARARVPDVSHNRRRADGPIDDVAIVVLFETPDKHRFRLVNWQCHPVCLGSDNRSISADYVGAFRRAVVDRTGDGAFYLNGCCGDLNPVGRGPEARIVTGEALAVQAVDAHPLRPASLSPVRVASREVAFPLRREIDVDWLADYATAERARLDTVHDTLARRECGAMIEWAEALLAAIRSGDLPDDPRSEITAIRLGDIAMVFLPCEALCAIGMALKAHKAVPIIMPVTCTGKVVGYIGTPEEFATGGYELDVAARYYGLLPFEPVAGQVLQDAALELLTEVGG
jgi:neutral ceramidase